MDDLFGPVIRQPRKPLRVMMHVIDVGDSGFSDDGYPGIAIFECGKCGHKTEWTTFRTVTEAKRGVPCPKCNRLSEG
jgi:DNA-directed RNA polymerase subunit RPC12/RpoP